MFPAGATATVLRQQRTVDAYGDEVATEWEESHELCGVALAWSTSGEGSTVEPARQAVTEQPQLLGPVGIDLIDGDRVVVDGVHFDVIGNTVPWVSPFTGASHGSTTNLRRVEG